MNLCNCNRCNCTLAALIVSVILGVVAAFLQITAVITLTPVFLWVALGIAVVYLGVLLVASALRSEAAQHRCLCPALNAVLLGILGTIFFALILLAVGITATSVVSAILVGLLTAAVALMFLASACLVRNVAGCSSER